MRSKLLTNHEIEYFVENAHHPPEEIRGEMLEKFTFWHFESHKVVYDWTLKATPDFDKVWAEFYITGVTRATTDRMKEPQFLISKSKPKYTYERR